MLGVTTQQTQRTKEEIKGEKPENWVGRGGQGVNVIEMHCLVQLSLASYKTQNWSMCRRTHIESPASLGCFLKGIFKGSYSRWCERPQCTPEGHNQSEETILPLID